MPDSAQSVLDKLKSKARETRKSYAILLQLFCQEEFLRRLEGSQYRENLILKGGLLIYSISSFSSRPTMDIDFLLRGTPNSEEHIMRVIENILNTKTLNSFIQFEVKGIDPLAEQREYHGMRINLVAHIKQTRTPFHIDMGVGDIIVPKAELRKLPVQLTAIQSLKL